MGFIWDQLNKMGQNGSRITFVETLDTHLKYMTQYNLDDSHMGIET